MFDLQTQVIVTDDENVGGVRGVNSLNLVLDFVFFSVWFKPSCISFLFDKLGVYTFMIWIQSL